MTEDWRYAHLRTQPHLIGISFMRKPYRAYRLGWEHDHCVGCWAKFVEFGIEEEGIVHEGYATTSEYVHGGEYEWVCVPCFEQFHDVMKWMDVTP